MGTPNNMKTFSFTLISLSWLLLVLPAVLLADKEYQMGDTILDEEEENMFEHVDEEDELTAKRSKRGVDPDDDVYDVGDMILTEGQTEIFEGSEDLTGKPPSNQSDISKRGAQRDSRWHWPKSGEDVIIMYKMDPEIKYNKKKRDAIKKALEWYETETCVIFKECRSYCSEHYVRIINDNGCYSYVGRYTRKSYQPVSIGDGCGYAGTVFHELMHAIGFFHEHSRPDRDYYVTVHLENLEKQDAGHNFDKQKSSAMTTQGTPYDIHSIMHYGSTYFAKRGKMTLTTLSGRQIYPNRDKPSQMDIQEINELYNCNVPQV